MDQRPSTKNIIHLKKTNKHPNTKKKPSHNLSKFNVILKNCHYTQKNNIELKQYLTNKTKSPKPPKKMFQKKY